MHNGVTSTGDASDNRDYVNNTGCCLSGFIDGGSKYG